MMRKKKRRNVWAEYERRKRRLAQKGLKSAKYEAGVQRIARELKI